MENFLKRARNEMKKIPKEFWEDWNWVFSNYSKLVKQYPNQWVAVVNKKIVSSGALGEVEDKAKAKTKRKHIPIIFIEDGSHVY